MAKFIFMLKPGDASMRADRIRALLSGQFPEHEFEAAPPDIPEFENSILPVLGVAGSGDEPGLLIPVDEALTSRVLEEFAELLDQSRSWQLS
jgi:hypothetical protein